MSTTIDPVTGLPMLSLPPLEQIPFTTPPVPWSDYTGLPATPRPTYYPDDAIPTISALAAQHPTTTRTESLRTDGNHALLVSDVSGGGGGGGSAVNVVPYNFNLTSTDEIEVGQFAPLGSIIYGLSMSWTSVHFSVAPSFVNGFVSVYIPGPSFTWTDGLILAHVIFDYNQMLNKQSDTGGSVNISFGNGIIFPGAFVDSPADYWLKVHSQNDSGGILDISIWCSA